MKFDYEQLETILSALDTAMENTGDNHVYEVYEQLAEMIEKHIGYYPGESND